jgi:hypothetical protein
LAFGTDDGLVIALLYGAGSDWVQNVVAAGHAQVKRSGTTREYTQPQLLGDAGMRLIPQSLACRSDSSGPATSSA